MRSSTTSQEDRIDVSFNLFPRSCQLNDGLPNVCSFACAPAQQLSHASVSAALVRTRAFTEREKPTRRTIRPRGAAGAPCLVRLDPVSSRRYRSTA